MVARTVWLLAVMLVTGCLYDPAFPSLSCTSDADCGDGSACSAGSCVVVEAVPDTGVDMAVPDTSDVPTTAARVEVLPETTDLSIGARTLLLATAFDEDDNELPGATVAWRSADESVVAVDQMGAVEAVAVGSADVIATVDGVDGSATINVLASVETVTVVPASATIGKGLSLLLVATALDGGGNELSGRDVAWSSMDDTVLEVTNDGTVTALEEGTATITATVEGVDGSASLTVEANPVGSVIILPDEPIVVLNEIKTFEAEIRDAADNVLDPRNRTFSWQLSNMAAASLIDFNVTSQRRIHGLQLGTATLSVDVESGVVTDDLALEVVLPTVDAVVITPLQVVPVGSTRQLETTVSDPGGNILMGRTHTWTSSNETVATVDAAGLLTALAPGVTTISADVEGVIATIDVDVMFLLAQVSSAATHSCGVSPDGVGFCWGDGGARLGAGPTVTSSVTPVPLLGSFLYTEIQTGTSFSCGLESSGAVHCWGDAGLTGVAAGSATDIPRVIDGGRTYTALALGASHACAIDDTGLVWCWGTGADGRLGNNDTVDAPTPVQVQFTPAGAPIALALGSTHSCVVTDAPKVWCWGNGADGALGNGGAQSSSVPVEVTSAEPFVEIAAGDQFSCARTAANAVYCWGTNATGQLGIGDLTTTTATTPLPLMGSLTSLGAGAEHGCGLDAVAGEVQCWGSPANFRLGNMDDTTVIDAPVANSGALLAAHVSGGAQHSCAVATDGRPYCWGANAAGQAGAGGVGPLQQPTLIWP